MKIFTWGRHMQEIFTSGMSCEAKQLLLSSNHLTHVVLSPWSVFFLLFGKYVETGYQAESSQEITDQTGFGIIWKLKGSVATHQWLTNQVWFMIWVWVRMISQTTDHGMSHAGLICERSRLRKVGKFSLLRMSLYVTIVCSHDNRQLICFRLLHGGASSHFAIVIGHTTPEAWISHSWAMSCLTFLMMKLQRHMLLILIPLLP